MYKNYESETIKPLIFTKKLKYNYKIIPFNKITSTLGHMRYFPPATQEWFNSIYTYNKNYIKNITIADKNLSKLIKSYFNLYFNNKLLRGERIITRYRRFAVNKVFISKAELKHSSDKVIITLYVYNEERRILLNKINNIESKLFSYINLPDNERRILSIKEKLDIIKKMEKVKNIFHYLNWLNNLFSEEIKRKRNLLIIIKNPKDKKEKQLELDLLERHFKIIKSIKFLCESYPYYNDYYEEIYGKNLKKTLIEKEIIIIAYYKSLLSLNKSKFEDKFILKLNPLVARIYNKEVEFNIVNLKSVYLNSHIFTQVISLKLKDRKNKLLKVLRSFLYMVKLPKVNLLKEKEKSAYINPRDLWDNKVKNLGVNNIFFYKKDNLNSYLLANLNSSNLIKKLKECKTNKCYVKSETESLLTSVLNILKYKNIGGVRLETKGRLTKRLTASRSVFKIRWRGSLKNMDSSYRGLSSKMLRGHIKSNVQYSMINSKTRNGSFGLKGWISGK